MKWLKEMLSDAKAILLAPLTNVLCIAGILFVFASFVDFNKAQGFTTHANINLSRAFIGFFLFAIGIGLHLLTLRGAGTRTKLDYQKGVEIKRGALTILIKSEEIQTIQGLTSNTAIVLPVNTTFVDDCASDKRTVTGAFFGEHFPGEIGNLPALFRELLHTKGIKPTENDQYAPGTTLILPDRFAKPAKVVITASTLRSKDTGIASTPHIICKCVENILNETADQRVDTVYLPIIGSGHGGIDKGLALLFILLALLHFTKSFHHVKNVHILVLPKDVNELNESKELRQIVAL